VSVFVVLALALFLMGFMGFAVDMTNLWFHRQMAQGAADAACQAGIMDVLYIANGAIPPGPGFAPGINFDCASSPSATPCRYAALNGYDGTGLVADAASNEVTVSFPGAVTGATPPPSELAPVPFLRVDVVDRVPLTFASLITGTRASDVRAFAECGLQQAKAPIPIIVLNPVCSQAFVITGNASLRIIGGPDKSVQVNSNSDPTFPGNLANCAATTAASSNQCGNNNNLIDLSQGGPNFSGSRFGSFSGQSPAPPGFLPGATGSWQTPAAPIADPFAMTPPPPVPSAAPLPTAVAYGQFGCPDATGNTFIDPNDGLLKYRGPLATTGCIRYQPGFYDRPIHVEGYTAIFDPGIYYIAPASYSTSWPDLPGFWEWGNPSNSGGWACGKGPCPGWPAVTGACRAAFVVTSEGVVRPSTVSGNGDGTMFYFSGGTNFGSSFFGSNAGTYGGRAVDSYIPAGSATSPPITCPAGTPSSPPPPASFEGNVLLGVCSGPYGDPLGEHRRMLFFQDRANGDARGQSTLSGGGGLMLAGTIYLHNCPNSPDCSPGYPTTYRAFVQFQGTPGSQTRVQGHIITDQLAMQGNPNITMVLDPNLVFNILKATLLR
jgi:hypothetical protein